MHESVYDEYLERAKARAEMRVVGDPFKAGVEQGPQVYESIAYTFFRICQVSHSFVFTFTSDQ